MAAVMAAVLLSIAAATAPAEQCSGRLPVTEVLDEVSLLAISTKLARVKATGSAPVKDAVGNPVESINKDPVEVMETGDTKVLSRCRQLPDRCKDAKQGVVPQGCIPLNDNMSMHGNDLVSEPAETTVIHTDLARPSVDATAMPQSLPKARHSHKMTGSGKHPPVQSKEPSKPTSKAELHEVISNKFSVIHKEPSKIAVASQCGGNFYNCDTGTFTESFKNHRAYANKHGYEYFLLSSHLSSRFAPWDRFPLISHLHDRGAEWVLFVEADSLIMNHSISVEGFVDKHGHGKDILGSGDQDDHFTGNILMRRSKFAHSVMCKAWKVCPSPRFDQLGAIMTVLAGGTPNDAMTWQPAYNKVWGCGITPDQQTTEMNAMPNATKNHAIFLPQQAMNSYDTPKWWKFWYDRLPHAYTPGDWIVHFAGSPAKPQQVPQFAHMANISNDELDSGTTSVDTVLVDDCSNVLHLSSSFDCSDVNVSEPLL